MSDLTFLGYHRPDGSVGIRNHVALLSIMGLTNPLGRRLQREVAGTIFIPTPNGRGQVGEDRALLERSLVGLAANPNIAAVCVLAYEAVSPRFYVDALRHTGKPVQVVTILENQGVIAATAQGLRTATELVINASAIPRLPAPLSKLSVALECGGSDPTAGRASNPTLGAVADRLIDAGGTVIFSETIELIGCERILAARAVSPAAGEAIIRTINDRLLAAEARGGDVRRVNPVPENIAAGLQTLEDKALGAMWKTGSRPIAGVLQYAERPPGPGLYLMDTPFFSTESMVGMAAGGAQLTLFSTGVGNNIGIPVGPALKVTGNPNTGGLMWEHVDVDVSGIVRGSEGVEQAASRVLAELLAVCSGKLVKGEVLDETDVAVSRLAASV